MTPMKTTKEIEPLIQAIHKSGWQFVLAITGGGSASIAELLTTPGGSRSILEAVVPYSPASLSDWIGSEPEQHCAGRTARQMAMAAFTRARLLAEPSSTNKLVGVGCTASLVSDRDKKGAHRIHVAYQTAEKTVSDSIVLQKGHRDRLGEERIASAMILKAMSEVTGNSTLTPEIGFEKNEAVDHKAQAATKPWKQLLLGELNICGATDSVPDSPKVIFPGAFNPIHEAHIKMAEIAESKLGSPVCLEVSIENVDKPILDYIEIANRVQQFQNRPAFLTRAAHFTQKAALFPEATFVVGLDTIVRLMDSKYYGNAPDQVDTAIEEIKKHGCRFLVFGRNHGGCFINLNDITAPSSLKDICDEVSEKEFRNDISSTKLRKEANL